MEKKEVKKPIKKRLNVEQVELEELTDAEIEEVSGGRLPDNSPWKPGKPGSPWN